MHMRISSTSSDPASLGDSARALFSLAVSQVGGTIDDLERGAIGLDELLESLRDSEAVVTAISLEGRASGFQLTIEFEARPATPVFGEGARQVIDAGLDQWNLDDRVATVSIGCAAERRE